MAGFTMCADCAREYADPLDRRFHAQPNACPACGPRVVLWSVEGGTVADGDAALGAAAALLREGRVLAVKGVGGFHLLVDGTSDHAVTGLRQRKGREEKPLAVMVRDLDAARAIVEVTPAAAALLASPAAPIVLLPRRPAARLSPHVAPGNPRVGVMLPYTPLHHLLLREFRFPVVATSGNRSEEPICTDEREALGRLDGIADAFLVHDRPIARHVDDSVVSLEGDEVHPIRRARGLAPLPVRRPDGGPVVLAVGGHLKNVVALAVRDRVVLSQHIGDLETPQAREAFERVIADLLDMYGVVPDVVAHDLHPDYASTRWLDDVLRGPAAPAWRARGLATAPRVAVQHHHAHLAAVLAEHGAPGPALGVTWDGTGHGTDGTVWGGEFLVGDASAVRRVASLRPFRLPGGDAAVREPRRSAVALLAATRGERAFDALPADAFAATEREALARMLGTGLQAPVTTSAGRLFDGVAALLGLRLRSEFEGQAAMQVEFAADVSEHGAYPLPLVPGEGRLLLDWEPTLAALLSDRDAGVPVPVVAARFHAALASGIVAAAKAAGEPRVALSGGCFQNRLLREQVRRGLASAGFEVLVHREVPCNDGGIALGQVAVAGAARPSAR
jgi:hydrogenase maturation protein HypF